MKLGCRLKDQHGGARSHLPDHTLSSFQNAAPLYSGGEYAQLRVNIYPLFPLEMVKEMEVRMIVRDSLESE